MSITSVGLVVNESKPEALQFAGQVVDWLAARGVNVCVDASSAHHMGRDDLASDTADISRTQLLITLGGDGTILIGSHLAAPHGIPLLGVHMGHFGFIAEAVPDDLLTHLQTILRGEMEVEERMMVAGEVTRAGQVAYGAFGLNDIAINKGARARMLNLRTSFGGGFSFAYPADGVVVATPTGSTAYALSAGGPIVEPTVQSLIVVPICAHTLAARPLVVPADEVVTLTVESGGGEVLFMADSMHVFPLDDGDTVTVKRAPFSARIVRLGASDFYRRVRERLLWGERVNP